MSSYIYIFCKVLLHLLSFSILAITESTFTLYFSHEIHPLKHSKNYRGRRACHSLRTMASAADC